jgi:hypothetical protein
LHRCGPACTAWCTSGTWKGDQPSRPASWTSGLQSQFLATRLESLLLPSQNDVRCCATEGSPPAQITRKFVVSAHAPLAAPPPPGLPPLASGPAFRFCRPAGIFRLCGKTKQNNNKTTRSIFLVADTAGGDWMFSGVGLVL